MVVDDANPWMYCTQCHDYYVPTEKSEGAQSQTVPKSTLRVPMRNRVEALYTRWYLDLGFVHMRESLLRILPGLKDQLPTAEEVLEFRKMRQTWIEHLRGCDPRSPRAQSNPVVEDLGKQLEEKDTSVRFVPFSLSVVLRFSWLEPPEAPQACLPYIKIQLLQFYISHYFYVVYSCHWTCVYLFFILGMNN